MSFISRIGNGTYLVLKNLHMNYIMKKIKKANSHEKVLTKKQQQEAKGYFSPYIRINPLYHNFYTEKTGIFDARYIPDNVYYNKINMFFNNHRLAKVIDNKCYYDVLFPDIAQPEVLACRRGGYWFVNGMLVSEQQMLTALESESEVFVKCAVMSQGGHGVNCIHIDKDGCFRETLQKLFATMDTDIVIQKALQQHSELEVLNSSSVNTMRIVTLLQDDGVKIYSSVLRIGGGKGRVDNFSSGGVAVGITEDGRLKEYGYFANGDRTAEHPSSGVKFAGHKLTAFELAKNMVKKAHLCVPDFRLISWDIATRQDGQPVLIETNLTNGELDFHQLCNGPLFGEDTKKILDEVFQKV